MVFAVLSLLCLCASVFLLYNITLLHFAAGSRAFLHIPDIDPRPAAYFEDIAILCCQIVGGISLTVSSISCDLRRCLKWSPLFIAAFAGFTWIIALAVAPLRLAS